jgi:hypothetical protein
MVGLGRVELPARGLGNQLSLLTRSKSHCYASWLNQATNWHLIGTNHVFQTDSYLPVRQECNLHL